MCSCSCRHFLLCKCLWVFPYRLFLSYYLFCPSRPDLVSRVSLSCLSHLLSSAVSSLWQHGNVSNASFFFISGRRAIIIPPCQISPLCFVSSSIGVCPLRGALHKLTCWWHSFWGLVLWFPFLSRFRCICVWLDGLDGGCRPLNSFWPKQWTVPAPCCTFTFCALRTGIPAARCIRNPSVWTWSIPLCTRPCPSASTHAAVRDTPAGNHAELHTCKVHVNGCDE